MGFGCSDVLSQNKLFASSTPSVKKVDDRDRSCVGGEENDDKNSGLDIAASWPPYCVNYPW